MTTKQKILNLIIEEIAIARKEDLENEKEFEKFFEWTDFSGDIGCFVLAKKATGFSTKETELEQIIAFIRDKYHRTSRLTSLLNKITNLK